MEEENFDDRFEREAKKLTLELLRELVRLARDYRRHLEPRLSFIQIVFSPSTATATGETAMGTPVAGPVILSTVGQVATASILGFDQNGNPWTGTIPPVTFTSDDTAGAIVTSVPSADGLTDAVTAVGNGVANITAKLSTAEGLALSDTESVTVTLTVTPPPPPLVLSSIKVAFA